MMYQPKTIVAVIEVSHFLEKRKLDEMSAFEMVYEVVSFIASSCQMDVMSIDHCYSEGILQATVIYVNNGRTISDVCNLMRPHLRKKDTHWSLWDVQGHSYDLLFGSVYGMEVGDRWEDMVDREG